MRLSKMKTLAAIVTYNRCDLLSRCIEHVSAQSRAPDTLLVINNGSTDGTVAMLEARGVNVITQENVGSAGGWHRGIQYALDNGFDAVWLMDDDGFPDPSAMARLEQALVPGVACVSSVVMREDRPNYFVFPFPVLNGAGLPIIFGWPRTIATLDELYTRSTAGTYPFVHLFNGALLSVDAVRQVGNVNRDFFIYGEEVDYFFRLRRAGSVCSILDAWHMHPDVSQRPYTPMKVYYYVKNTLILNSRYLNAVWLRNILTIAAVLFRTARRNGLGVAVSYLLSARAPSFYRAIVLGLRGRVGRDFNG